MLSLGDVLDEKYVLESVLGRGGTGVVFRARHIGLNAARAIKVMHRELAENEDLLARFLNEAKLAEELRHPHIVTLYDLSPFPTELLTSCGSTWRARRWPTLSPGERCSRPRT
jgi:serine/threonine-protein kinase